MIADTVPMLPPINSDCLMGGKDRQAGIASAERSTAEKTDLGDGDCRVSIGLAEQFLRGAAAGIG